MLFIDDEYICQNKALVALILFICIFYSINYIKPNFLYLSNGSIREFGVGYKNKTIFPIWLMAIVLGILCYILVLYYSKC